MTAFQKLQRAHKTAAQVAMKFGDRYPEFIDMFELLDEEMKKHEKKQSVLERAREIAKKVG